MSDVMTPEEALRKLVARCSVKECCVSDVREKLHNWNIQRVDGDNIIEHLLAERYIDEARYCKAFVHDKFHFDGWGRIKIGYTLRHKQIDSLTISQSLQAIDEEEYARSLYKILAGKMRGLKALPPSTQYEKLMRFALSRGFEQELIHKSLQELSLSCEVGSET